MTTSPKGKPAKKKDDRSRVKELFSRGSGGEVEAKS